MKGNEARRGIELTAGGRRREGEAGQQSTTYKRGTKTSKEEKSGIDRRKAFKPLCIA